VVRLALAPLIYQERPVRILIDNPTLVQSAGNKPKLIDEYVAADALS
jgi:hypothetical protein